MTSVAFSLDGKYITSGGMDRTVKIWDVASGREARTLEGHTDVVYSVAFSPNSRRIASGSNDKTVKIWKVTSGLKVRTLTGCLLRERSLFGSGSQYIRTYQTCPNYGHNSRKSNQPNRNNTLTSTYLLAHACQASVAGSTS